MFRSAFSSSRKYAAFALVLVLAIGAVTYFFTRQQPIPATGAESVVRAPAVSAPDANVAPNQGQASGLAYRLKTNAKGVRVMAPKTDVSPGDKTYSLGAGYRLVVNAAGGMILPPAGPSTSDGRVDLSSGYALAISGGYGRILSPSTRDPLLPMPNDPTLRKEYIGGGFWLITGQDGGLILQDETK